MGATDDLLKSSKKNRRPTLKGRPLATKGMSATDALLKGGKGGGGGVKKTGLGLLGAVGSALSMPQQVVFKLGQGIGDVASGKTRQGLKGIAGAAGEVLSLGQAGGDIGFSEAITSADRRAAGQMVKLPRGVETAANVLADPLNFVTFGAGAVAKQGLKTTGKVLGTEVAERVAKVGLKKATTEAERATIRAAIVREATEAGSRNATKTADKTIRALGARAQSGITAKVPFTGRGATILSGDAAGKIGRVTGLTAGRDAVLGSVPMRRLGKAFTPGRAVSEAVGSEAGAKVLAAGSNRFAREGAEVADLSTRIKSILADYESTAGRKFGPADDAFAARALESGDLAGAAAARPEMARVLNAFNDIRTTTTAGQVSAGVLEQGAVRDEATYLHRLLTPEARRSLGKAKEQAVRSGGSVSSALRQGATRARKIAPDYPTVEINEAVAAIRAGRPVLDETLASAVKGIAQKLKPGTQLYQESAVASLADRGVSAAKAISSAQYVAELRGVLDDTGEAILLSADDLAERAAKLVEGGMPARQALKAALPERFVEFDLPKLGGFAAPGEVAAEIKKFMSVIGADDSVTKFQEMLKTADRWWKSTVTASLPAGISFGARNARSNAFMMLADGAGPADLVRGGQFQRRISKAVASNASLVAAEGVESAMRSALSPADFTLWDAARRLGVIGDGFYMSELGGALLPGLGKKHVRGGIPGRVFKFVAGSEGAAATKGRAINNAIEQHARISHFLYSVDQLGDLQAAAIRTKSILFDYQAITPTEQRIVKRIVPFWVFMRKNTPAQFRSLIDNPSRYIFPEKISRATTEPLPDDSPEYLRRAGARTTGFGPFAGLISTPERPFQAAVKTLEPVAQLAGALLPGNQGGIEADLPQALRSVLSVIGGEPGSPVKWVAQEAGQVNLFTGYRLAQDEGRKRALAEAYPALKRLPALTARLPIAERRRKERQEDMPTLAEIAGVLGFKIEPPQRTLGRKK